MSGFKLSLNDTEVQLIGEGAIVEVSGSVMQVLYTAINTYIALAIHLLEVDKNENPIRSIGQQFIKLEFPSGEEGGQIGMYYDLPFSVNFIYVGGICSEKQWVIRSIAHYVCEDIIF